MVGEHWINERHLRVTSLDPSRPAYVMYYPLPGREHEQVLVGTAYGMVQPWGADAPDGFAGTHDVWHVHVLCTALDHLGSTFTASAAECLELGGEPAKHQLAMLHVWFEPKNPEGPFAPDNVALPFVAAGLAPPAPGDLRDPADAQRMRKLALALSETYGATPRGGGFIEQRPTKIFARQAEADRTRIRRRIPKLREAQQQNDPTAFAAAADEAIGAWERIRAAYLEAAPSDVLRQMLETWFTEAVLSNAHVGTHR
jgi:hypothetical protein